MRVYHVFNPHTAKEPISPFLASDWSMFVNLLLTKATRGRIGNILFQATVVAAGDTGIVNQ